jgi:DNA-binding MarR family transcriptional regulator
MSRQAPKPAPSHASGAKASGGTPGGDWTFLSNHAHVLICLASDPELLLREVAQRVGITERAVQKILVDLEAEGLLTRTRDGRRNRYQLHLDQPLRHALESHRSVRELIALVTRST